MNEPTPEKTPLPENLTFTLTRQQWSLIVFLAGRGALHAAQEFIDKRIHTIECITGFADAVHALQDLYKAEVPDAAAVVAKDTLPGVGE